jgi:hypothetical protein
MRVLDGLRLAIRLAEQIVVRVVSGPASGRLQPLKLILVAATPRFDGDVTDVVHLVEII